jgi:DNA polymerase-3 subunit epsilon
MYAIVDIETTGGHASANGITEVAILVHDGKFVIEQFKTLINPLKPIPIYIQSLTGIDDEMVSAAPKFHEVAHRIYELLHDKVFVAHNVNFDFSFIHFHLAAAGFHLQTKKLCTVRLSRKIQDRHRAFGDAQATAELFSMLIEQDKEGHISKTLNQRSKEQSLPPHLPKVDMDKLPSVPGIYYFHNSKLKVIYVGKAKNIRKRVASHFTNNKPGRQKQDFLREIHHITFQECGTELMALILEAVEIKRLWPAYNRSLKRFEYAYGLYSYEDQGGYIRLVIDTKKKFSRPHYTFNGITEGYTLVKSLILGFNLCPKLCFVQRNTDSCIIIGEQTCQGACEQLESPESYNLRVNSALKSLFTVLPGFLLIDEGRTYEERSCLLIENGQFFGMGYISSDMADAELSLLKQQLTPYPENDYIRNMILNAALRFPHKVREISIN